MSHLRGHSLNDATDHRPGTNGTLLGTESSAIAEKAFGTAATANLILQRQANGQVTLPAGDPVLGTDAANKQYVDEQVVSGNTWKEITLAPEQLLSGSSGGVLQGMLATIAVNLAAGDTFIITDGTTTETFLASAGAPPAFGFQVGGSAAATLTNLVAAINTDSTLWSAVETSGLDAYFSGGEASQLVVYRTATPGGAADDRIYGVIASAQSDVQVVEFATGDQDYRQQSGTQSDLPAADPAANRFGFGRVYAGLNGGDTHRIADDNTAYTWDSDDELWQQTATGSAVIEGDGIDITSNKVSTDTSTATSEQKFGAISKRALADGSAEGAAADAGNLAVRTNDTDLNVSASNELQIKPGTRLDNMRATAVWESQTSPDREPTLAELNAALGTAVGDIGHFAILAERSTALGQVISAGGAGGVGSTSGFWALKIANAGALADYQLVEMD
jgi:hypothetical protein